ncbi:MAG: efflux RND transporter permease subunit, partial [Bacteroidota bacterium]
GDFAIHQILPPGSSLRQGVEVSGKVQRALLLNFPEVEDVVVKLGTSEVPTDPMPIEVGDVMVIMKPKSEWVNASTKEEMFERMREKLSIIPGLEWEFTQPVQMRFNELMTGIRQDIGIKIFGENLDILYKKAKAAERLLKPIEGVGDLYVEQVTGLPQMVVRYKRDRVAQYGLNISDLNRTLKTGFAGEKAGVVFENERRFDMVVRLDAEKRTDIESVRNLYVALPNGHQIPLKEVASVEIERGPMQISRDNARRRITIGINARGRDVQSLIREIDETLTANLSLPPGYSIEYGGAFENLKSAQARLALVVPIALTLIFILVFFALRSISLSTVIFMAIPFAAMGGVWALYVRGLPFSISAGVGFIVLSGVAVLNGLVLIHSMEDLKAEGVEDLHERIIRGTKSRIRPILLTASTDILGFLPMALSNSGGAEVQRPLATVVIGGLLSATLLTLIVLPILYSYAERGQLRPGRKTMAAASVFAIFMLFSIPKASAQTPSEDTLTVEAAVRRALAQHPEMEAARLRTSQQLARRKTAADLPRTDFDFMYGQINSTFLDYQFQVRQRIDFPSTYTAKRRLVDAKADLSELAGEVTALELEGRVRTLFAEAAFQQRRLTLLQEWEAAYSRFAEVAAKRFQAGETNGLEKAAAAAKYEEVKVEVGYAVAEVAATKGQLALMLGLDAAPILGFSEGMDIAGSDSANGGETPWARFDAQQVEVQRQAVDVVKKGYLPGISGGYFLQQIDGTGGLQGFSVGLDLPLFYGATKARVEAGQLGVEVARQEMKAKALNRDMALQAAEARLKADRERLRYYRETGLPNARLLARTARKSYEAG